MNSVIGRHRQLCAEVLRWGNRVLRIPVPGGEPIVSAQQVPDGLVRELIQSADDCYHHDAEYHARVEMLGRALELINRQLPPPDEHPLTRDLAWRVMAVLPIVDATIPDPATTPPRRTGPRTSW